MVESNEEVIIVSCDESAEFNGIVKPIFTYTLAERSSQHQVVTFISNFSN